MRKKRAFETPFGRGFGRRPFFTVACGNAPGRWFQPPCFWPKAILSSAVMPEILGEYGLRPNIFNTHHVPGTMPQATVRIGLRPKRFTLATKMRNFKKRKRGSRASLAYASSGWYFIFYELPNRQATRFFLPNRAQCNVFALK